MINVKEHIITKTLHEVVVTPDHAQRSESEEFRAAESRRPLLVLGMRGHG